MRFEEGKQHSPLAPPPSPGYTKGGGWGRGGLFLTGDERRWLEKHGMKATEEGALDILERIQAWDAEIARRISTLCVNVQSLPKAGSTEPSQRSWLSPDWWTTSMSSAAPRVPETFHVKRSKS